MFHCLCAATVFNNANQHINVYGDDIEVDYRGYEVRFISFINLCVVSVRNFSKFDCSRYLIPCCPVVYDMSLDFLIVARPSWPLSSSQRPMN